MAGIGQVCAERRAAPTPPTGRAPRSQPSAGPWARHPEKFCSSVSQPINNTFSTRLCDIIDKSFMPARTSAQRHQIPINLYGFEEGRKKKMSFSSLV